MIAAYRGAFSKTTKILLSSFLSSSAMWTTFFIRILLIIKLQQWYLFNYERSLLFFGKAHNLWLKVRACKLFQKISVELMPACHCESPFIFDLPAQIQINLGDQKAIWSPGKRRSPRSIRCCNIAASIEMPKLFMSNLLITTRKLIWIRLSSYSIDSNCEIMICNCSITSFDTPEWLWQTIYSRRRIVNDFSSV